MTKSIHFWPRRRIDKTAEISAPVLISRSDVGRKCVPLDTVATSTSEPSTPTTFSPLRMNPVSASASASAAPSARGSTVSSVVSAQSAPARIRTVARQVPAELASFTFPATVTASIASFDIPNTSSYFSDWSGSDDEDEEDDDDSDECDTIDDNESVIDDCGVEPAARVNSVGGIAPDLFALSIASRNEFQKTLPALGCRSPGARARMAIYIPSTSSSDADNTDVEDGSRDKSDAPVYYPAVPSSRTGSINASPISCRSLSPFGGYSFHEQDLDDLLAAYQ